MKKKVQWLMLVLGLLGPAISEAKTLEEILKEKGVITAEEYEAAVKQKGLAYYKPGAGLTVETLNGDFRTQIGGYLQMRYSFSDFDADEDTSELRIRRLKLVLQGNLFTPELKYKYQAEISNGFTTEDVLLSYRLAEPLTLQVGQFKPPQARQELVSAARQLFAERSLANDTFNLGRDLGVQASGSFLDKLLAYRVGVFNGNGPNIGNAGTDHMFAGRIDYYPLGEIKFDEPHFVQKEPVLNFPEGLLVNIGASAAWEKVTGDDIGSNFNRDNDVMDVALGLDSFNTAPLRAQFAADYGNEIEWLLSTANLVAQWNGLSVGGEYYRLDADPASGSDWDADGYYVQAGYQIIPRTLEVAARYSAVESEDAVATAQFDKSDTQFGVNYYFKGHYAKVQADYTFAEDDLADEDDQIFRLQGQVYY